MKIMTSSTDKQKKKEKELKKGKIQKN